MHVCGVPVELLSWLWPPARRCRMLQPLRAMLLGLPCRARLQLATTGLCHAGHGAGTTPASHYACLLCFLPRLQRDNFDFFITLGMGLGSRLGRWVLCCCCMVGAAAC